MKIWFLSSGAGAMSMNRQIVSLIVPFTCFLAGLCGSYLLRNRFGLLEKDTVRAATASPESEARSQARHTRARLHITRKQLTNVEHTEGMNAPMNTFANIPAYPTADMKAVVRPNFDTLDGGCVRAVNRGRETDEIRAGWR